jgi:hypothetical protein
MLGNHVYHMTCISSHHWEGVRVENDMEYACIDSATNQNKLAGVVYYWASRNECKKLGRMPYPMVFLDRGIPSYVFELLARRSQQYWI